MKDNSRTKKQLINELAEMRLRIARLQESSPNPGPADEYLKAANLKAEEEKSWAEAIIAAIGDGISICSPDFKILYQNQIHKGLFGDRVGHSCYKAYRQREDICEECPVAMSFRDGNIHKTERSLITDKGILHIEVTASALRDMNGKITAGIEVVRDITDRKKAEETLRERESFLHDILDSIQDGISILDKDLNIIRVNPTIEKWYAHNTPLTGRKCYDAYHGRTEPCIKCPSCKTLQSKKPASEIVPLTGPDGIKGWLDLYSFPLLDSRTGMLLGVIEYVRNITKRKKAEDDLKESEELFRSLAEQSPNMIFINMKGNVVYANEKCETMMGYKREEFYSPGFNFLNIIAPDFQELVKTNYSIHMEGRDIPPYEYELVTKKGEKIEVIITTKLITYKGDSAILGVVTDITNRKKMESELLNAKKLESLGILAGGIAHDFNNILTAIIGNISLAKMYARPGYEIYDILAEVEKASARARDLTHHLLTFSKSSAPAKKIISTEEMLKEAVNLALSGANIRCEFSIQADLPPIEADEGQMGQAISNIVLNAMQSMPGGGTINVGAESLTLESDSDILPLKKGEYVKISIKDTGVGIPEKNLPKVFDPFFTTKEYSTGLGLTNSYSIVRKHNGHISLESKVEEGTTLYIYLPASHEKLIKAKSKKKMSITGRGRILVMDDEELVRAVVGRMLSQCGYEAEVVSNGAEVIKAYTKSKESGHPFDVVILDLVIPGGMGGKETAEKLLEMDQNVKLVISSGYSDDPIVANFEQYGFKGVLVKPYETSELSQTLHNITKGAGGSSRAAE